MPIPPALLSAGISVGQGLLTSYVQDQEAKLERRRIRAFQQESRENFLATDTQLRRNVAEQQEQLKVMGRVAIANAERDASYRRGVAALSAADRGVSGGSVEALGDALDIQEVESTLRIESDIRNQGFSVAQQARDIRENAIRQLREIEATPMPERVDPWMAGLQALASGAQSYMQTSSVYKQGFKQGANAGLPQS